ncbi:hypothetical protein KVT40_004714 [Elsinoe batatas]|uniref:Uncharacterized protein n=1 Tax=Elsinoe batatas TaxID=2601811 RepID=A0A8K0L3V9_9PEZI|nr:hypothetical protein KVT40_004714 [Elsinoe batatas]
MVKIFITGATGYIGGDALHALLSTHPEYSYTALVRSGPRAVSLAATHPTLRLVYGDLSSTSLITSEARAADIVLHLADADDAPSAQAIAEGLRSDESEEVYDDGEGVGSVTSLPDQALHRGVDKLVLAAGDEAGQGGKVRTAVVCPPCIYGRGRGAGNTRSMQVPELARVTVERGEGVRVGKGRARWTGLHVADLADLFVRLVEEAVKGGGEATWGREGYYFAEDGEFYWGDVSEWVLEEVRKKLLGWQPKRHGLREEVKDAVEVEAKKLGKLPGHAAKAAGDA